MSERNKRPRQSDGSDKDNEDWQKQPPYASDKKQEAKFKGSCHCKDVTYELYAEKPLSAHYCHCDTCQKLHGAPAHWSCVMDKENVLFTCDPDKLAFYRTEDQKTVHELPCKVSCARCHSPVCDEGRNKILMFPSTIDFEKSEDREPFMPQKHIFYSMRCVDVSDDMPKWEKLADKSERMDEENHHGQKGVAGQNKKDSK